jgi:hypothetical protein
MEKGKFLISFMDILAFRLLVNHEDIDTIYNSLNRIIVNLRNLYSNEEPNESYAIYDDSGSIIRGPIPSPIYSRRILQRYFTNFSDSIILYIKLDGNYKEDIEKLKSICWVSNIFISKSILDTNSSDHVKIAMRCGIAMGYARINQAKGIHVGQPIIDAYELCEHQQWMGGAIHPSVPQEFCEELVGFNNELYKYKVPIKPKKEEKHPYNIKSQYALNWVYHHPSLKRWVKDKLREGPTLIDIGGHVKRYKWESRNRYEKGINTLNFVKQIDKEWNSEYNVDRSTCREFNYPKWYV